jgi:sugar phosphate isomerase/epimerase
MVVHPASIGLARPEDRPDVPDVRRLLSEAADVGIRLLLENVTDSIWALDRVLDEIGDDPEETNLGICIDIGHARMSHDAGRHPVANYLERYRGPLRHLHLHDTHGDADEHLVPGRGTIDWIELADVLARIRFSGAAILEFQAPEGAERGLHEALRFVRDILSG